MFQQRLRSSRSFTMSATEESSGDAVEVVVGREEEEVEEEEMEFVKCECCGLTEECTPAYVALVRERHGGRWICGLCAEAVEDEVRRSRVLITPGEAMDRHASFRQNLLSPTSAVAPAERLVAAVRQVLRRSLESPRAVRSTPSSPRSDAAADAGAGSALARTASGFPALLG